MTIAISKASPVPLHLQIRRAIQEQIASGTLGPGARLPTEHEYAQQFGVSIAPVRQALLDLAALGLLIRRKGRGTFVRGLRVEAEIDLLTSFTDSLRGRGVPVRMQMLVRERAAADPDVAGALGIRPGSPVVRLRRLAWIGDEPAAILDAYLPARQFGKLISLDFDAGRSLYATLETEFGIRFGVARSRLEVGRLSEEDGPLLHEPEGAAMIRIASVTEDVVGRPVEVAWVTYRADRFAFTMTSRSTSSRSQVDGADAVSAADGS
ncbi:MAG TPA: GntR family transcriptional regulator [Candidatus Acidoferrum sp.]|nr:GntR family transcriptional regulator [Candidatus Acidoferrum sp.]